MEEQVGRRVVRRMRRREGHHMAADVVVVRHTVLEGLVGVHIPRVDRMVSGLVAGPLVEHPCVAVVDTESG